MAESEATPWGDLVRPLVKKCRLAVMLHMKASFNEDGATALADLLEKMAAKLDHELAALNAGELSE